MKTRLNLKTNIFQNDSSQNHLCPQRNPLTSSPYIFRLNFLSPQRPSSTLDP